MRMAETTFGITYNGPALNDGRMPVRDLAPALLAVGDLYAQASLIIYPDREPVALHIEATERGSFDVHLILEAKKTWDELVDVFGNHGAAALANLVQLVAGGTGLLVFIKKLRGRAIVKRESAPDPGTTRLSLSDHTTLDVLTEVLRLYESIEVRRDAREVVEPLTRDGIEEVEFRANAEEIVVEKKDVPSFDVPEGEPEQLTDQIIERHLAVVSPVFEEGRKWRFTDGLREFNADIQDEAFIARVDAGERFGKGDVLRCRLREVQTRRVPGGLRTEYTILQVLDHLTPPEQLQIGDEG